MKIRPISKNIREQTLILAMPRFEDMFESYYATQILKGITSVIERSEYDLLLHIYSPQMGQYFLDTDLADSAGKSSGIIFADIDGDRGLLERIGRLKIPYVILNNVFEEKNINYVGVDNRMATFEVINYLVKLGHRRIATITGDLSTQAGRRRLEGYREGLKAHKITHSPEYEVEGGFKKEKARNAMLRLIKLRPRPTAIFAACDLMGFEALMVAVQENIKIPDDISIVGFDDAPFATMGYVSLATVSQPLKDVGALGAKFLIQLMEKKINPPVQVALPTTFLMGSSCGRPPK